MSSKNKNGGRDPMMIRLTIPILLQRDEAVTPDKLGEVLVRAINMVLESAPGIYPSHGGVVMEVRNASESDDKIGEIMQRIQKAGGKPTADDVDAIREIVSAAVGSDEDQPKRKREVFGTYL
jgi:hypothetical protein